MMKKHLLTVIVAAVCLAGICYGVRNTKYRNGESRLYEFLMKHHEPGSRPVMNANSTVQINFSLSLNQIIDLVEKNQTLITQMTLSQSWKDELLVWNPRDYDGLQHIILPAAEIWLPDLYIFNNAEKGYEGFLNLNGSRVRVENNGEVFWSLMLIVKSSCAVEMTYFPFDNQKCQVRIGSWLYDSTQVDISLTEDGFDMSNYINNSEFLLLNYSLTKEKLTSQEFSESYFQVIPDFTPSKDSLYPQAILSIHIRRIPVYYMYTIVAPTLILCIMMVFSFQLPCESGDKVGIGLTVFLSLYLLQLAIAENIPESNSLPLISLFLTLVMTLNSLSLMFATMVINIKKKGDRKPCQAVPDSILLFCQKVLAKITFTRKLEFRDFYTTCMEEEKLLKKVNMRNPSEDLTEICKIKHGAGLIKRVLESPNMRQRRKSTQESSQTCLHSAENSTPFLSGGFLATPNLSSRRPSKCESSTSSKLMMAHKNKKLEWYFVAEVVDKILFMLFLLALLVTVLTTLWLIPELHKYDYI